MDKRAPARVESLLSQRLQPGSVGVGVGAAAAAAAAKALGDDPHGGQKEEQEEQGGGEHVLTPRQVSVCGGPGRTCCKSNAYVHHQQLVRRLLDAHVRHLRPPTLPVLAGRRMDVNAHTTDASDPEDLLPLLRSKEILKHQPVLLAAFFDKIRRVIISSCPGESVEVGWPEVGGGRE